MKVVLSPDAEAEFDHVVRYLASRSPQALARFLDDLQAAKDLLVAHPRAGQAVGRVARRLLLRSHPYQLVYIAEAEAITVYAVAHLKRRPRYWRKRLP